MSGAKDFITDIYELANVDGTPLEEVNERVAKIREMSGQSLWSMFGPPPSPSKGDIWLEPTKQNMYVFNGEYWVLVST